VELLDATATTTSHDHQELSKVSEPVLKDEWDEYPVVTNATYPLEKRKQTTQLIGFDSQRNMKASLKAIEFDENPLKKTEASDFCLTTDSIEDNQEEYTVVWEDYTVVETDVVESDEYSEYTIDTETELNEGSGKDNQSKDHDNHDTHDYNEEHRLDESFHAFGITVSDQVNQALQKQQQQQHTQQQQENQQQRRVGHSTTTYANKAPLCVKLSSVQSSLYTHQSSISIQPRPWVCSSTLVREHSTRGTTSHSSSTHAVSVPSPPHGCSSVSTSYTAPFHTSPLCSLPSEPSTQDSPPSYQANMCVPTHECASTDSEVEVIEDNSLLKNEELECQQKAKLTGEFKKLFLLFKSK
jgi:hypothetical protein